MMGRKRVSNPRISFSISVDSHLLNKLNMRMGYNQSRSRWIADAIRAKIDSEEKGMDLIESVSNVDLLLELQYRGTNLPINKMEREAIRSMLAKLRDLPDSN